MKIPVYIGSPIVVWFALICVAIQAVQSLTGGLFFGDFFATPGTFLVGPIGMSQYVTHIMGHGSIGHLVSNLPFLLMFGQVAEEKYSKFSLLALMFVTAVGTGVLATLLGYRLTGASGIVFLFIALAAFAKTNERGVPLISILLAIIFLGKEVLAVFENDNVSQMAHIAGFVIGMTYVLGTQMKKPVQGAV